MNIIKGLPTAAIPSGKIVELWVASPTGDSSDSLIFPIECRSEDQARLVADLWKDLISAPAALNESRAAYRELKRDYDEVTFDPDLVSDATCDVCDGSDDPALVVVNGEGLNLCGGCSGVAAHTTGAE